MAKRLNVISTKEEATALYFDQQKSLIAVNITMPDGTLITNLNPFVQELTSEIDEITQ